MNEKPVVFYEKTFRPTMRSPSGSHMKTSEKIFWYSMRRPFGFVCEDLLVYEEIFDLHCLLTFNESQRKLFFRKKKLL